jgi:hypothetical protein
VWNEKEGVEGTASHLSDYISKMRSTFMITVKELEKVVTDLPADKLAEFRAWFESFDSAQWDQQFEEDVKTGKLEPVAEKAIKDYGKRKARSV